MSSLIFCASARSSGSENAAMKALRSEVPRSAGTLGGSPNGRRKVAWLPVIVGIGEAYRERHPHAGEVGMAPGILLHQDAHHVLGQPVRIGRIDAGPAEAAEAVHLLALERERDLTGSRIT